MMYLQHVKYHISFNNIPQNCRLCIYGAGSAGRMLFELLREQRPKVDVVCFADSYKTGTFLERPVISPHQIKDATDTVFDLLLIASHAAANILQDLHSRDIHNARAVSLHQLNGCFSTIELNHRAGDIEHIRSHLATRQDLKLFNLLLDLRWADSQDVVLLEDVHGDIYTAPKDADVFVRDFPHRSKNCYFDFSDLTTVAVCVQGGIYSGQEAFHVLNSTPNLKAMYGFELLGASHLDPNLAGLLNSSPLFELVPMGLWSEKTTLEFVDSLAGSYLCAATTTLEKGQKVQVTDLDSFLDERHSPPLDFFFCDIENAELPCLQGMRKRLLSDRPQLAVSIYHSREQFLDVPLFLINLLEDYVFHIGHYSGTLNETTFYAIPQEIVGASSRNSPRIA